MISPRLERRSFSLSLPRVLDEGDGDVRRRPEPERAGDEDGRAADAVAPDPAAALRSRLDETVRVLSRVHGGDPELAALGFFFFPPPSAFFPTNLGSPPAGNE
jgi:hypothetical protein